MKNTCNISSIVLDYVNSEEFGVGCNKDIFLREIAKAYEGSLSCSTKFCNYKKEPCDNTEAFTCSINFNVSVDDSANPCPKYTVVFTIENLTGDVGDVTYQWAPKDAIDWEVSSPTDETSLTMSVLSTFDTWSDIIFATVTDSQGCQITVQVVYNWTAKVCEICVYPNTQKTEVFIYPLALNEAVFTT